MSDDLYSYYDSELGYFRKLGAEFASSHTKNARFLRLEADKESPDPHVERLIQSVAFITARIRRKLDDEFPEVVHTLLDIIAPHYLTPIPSIALLQCVPQQSAVTVEEIARGETLFSRPLGQDVCRFRTVYPVKLWPFHVATIEVLPPARAQVAEDFAAVLRLELRRNNDNVCIGNLGLDRLQFYLSGPQQFPLYDFLLRHVRRVLCRSGTVTAAATLAAAGFNDDEALLQSSPAGLSGYRLLQEYFAFPKKFLFIDIAELKENEACARAEGSLELLFLLDRRPPPSIERELTPHNLRLSCTPVINLFRKQAEPITLDETAFEYLVQPDWQSPNAHEVYAVRNVTCFIPHRPEATRTVLPLYGFRPSASQTEQAADTAAYYLTTRRDGLTGTDVYLSVVDLAMNPAQPAVNQLLVEVECTNRDVPNNHKNWFTGSADFQLEGEVGNAIEDIVCVEKPSATRRLQLGKGTAWRLFSHLSLNFLSLTTGPQALEALRALLRLYDFVDTAEVSRHVDGLHAIATRAIVARPQPAAGEVASGESTGYARGLEITIELDEAAYRDSSVALFAAVLERFWGHYVSINSFIKLVARNRQREVIKQWPPRSGTQLLG